MTADDATIKAVAEAIKNTGVVVYRYTELACAAIEELEELGWGKKPTVTEALRLLDQDKNWDLQRLVDAGFLVDDQEPEWEPTEDAVREVVRAYVSTPEGHANSFANVLKHIRANPHLIGMGEEE